jgi:hypothetical protein
VHPFQTHYIFSGSARNRTRASGSVAKKSKLKINEIKQNIVIMGVPSKDFIVWSSLKAAFLRLFDSYYVSPTAGQSSSYADDHGTTPHYERKLDFVRNRLKGRIK